MCSIPHPKEKKPKATRRGLLLLLHVVGEEHRGVGVPPLLLLLRVVVDVLVLAVAVLPAHVAAQIPRRAREAARQRARGGALRRREDALRRLGDGTAGEVQDPLQPLVVEEVVVDSAKEL